MRDPVKAEWNQVLLSGHPLPQWHARLPGPPQSVIFALVSETLMGTWYVTFSPNGRGLKEPLYYRGPYLTREKAMRQAEKWASYHGHKVPAQPPPPCGMASRSPKG